MAFSFSSTGCTSTLEGEALTGTTPKPKFSPPAPLFWLKPAPCSEELPSDSAAAAVEAALDEAGPGAEVLVAAVVVVAEAAVEAVGFAPMVVAELMAEAAGL